MLATLVRKSVQEVGEIVGSEEKASVKALEKMKMRMSPK